MSTLDETVTFIEDAPTWDDRINRIRLVPQRHGTGDHPAIYAQLAKDLYVPHLGPDFGYVNIADFYELSTFESAYVSAVEKTENFSNISVDHLTDVIQQDPTTLLVFRTITGLTRPEFAESTKIIGASFNQSGISQAKVDSMEHSGTTTSPKQARLIAETIDHLVNGTLFGNPPDGYRTKQDKPDTVDGWETVTRLASEGVPYSVFLHQRHYGGSFRQLLDATSTRRGDLIEDAVEAVFDAASVLFIRTGSHNQAEIEERFEVRVRPAPDFVVYDQTNSLRALLECKGANDGGTARDKALRFKTLRDEAVRLGGVPLFAVLGGLGWLRVNDTLGPVIRDTDGRVFSVANLNEMLGVSPFPALTS